MLTGGVCHRVLSLLDSWSRRFDESDEGPPRCGPRARKKKNAAGTASDVQPRGHDRLMCGCLAALCALCYANSLWGDFVHDDLSAIKGNSDVTGLQPVARIFLDDFWGRPMSDPASHKSYRPLTVLTFRLNNLVHGLSATGFHLVNVILHSAVTVLLVVLCRQGLRLGTQVTWIAGLLFATHPVHTEAVTGIVGRADVLACLLFLLSFLSYLRCLKKWECWEKPPSPLLPSTPLTGEDIGSWWYCLKQLWPSLLLATASMLAKEHGITVFGVNALWDIITSFSLLRRSLQGSVQRKRIFILGLTTLLLIIFRILMLQGSLPQFCDQDNPASFSPHFTTRFLTFAYLPAFNFWLLLAPSGLSYDWQLGSISLVEEWRDLRNAASLTFYAGLAAIAFKILTSRKKRERRVLGMGLLLLVVPFLPASNLFFRVGFVVAERILYISSMGFCLLMGSGLERLMMRQRFRRLCWTPLLLLLLLALFVCKTLLRNADWDSRESLFTSGLKLLPHNAKMHYNYANLQKDLGNIEEAVYHYRQALRLWTTHASAHNNLGTLLNDTGLAELHFNEAIRINPRHAHAHFNLANLKYQEGYPSLAMALMERSVELDGSNPDALTNLATMYADSGQPERAEQLHRRVLQTESENADHLNNYAAFLQKTGRLHEALSYYQKALKVDGNHTAALVNAARLMRKLRLNDHAESLYQRALEKESDPQVKDGLGVLYLHTGRPSQAERLFREVLDVRPNDTLAKVHLAQAKFHQRMYAEAEGLLRSLVVEQGVGIVTPSDDDEESDERLSQPMATPCPREALHQLASLLGQLNRTREAAQLLRRALTACSHPHSNPSLDCAPLYALHGDFAKDLQDIDAAVQSYKKAVRIHPNLPHVHLNLGAIYHMKGDFSSAWHHYRQALSQDPTNEVLLQNMNKLRKAELQRAGLACSTSNKR